MRPREREEHQAATPGRRDQSLRRILAILTLLALRRRSPAEDDVMELKDLRHLLQPQ